MLTITDILPGNVAPISIPPWSTNIAVGGLWAQPLVVTITDGIVFPLTNTVQVSTKEGVMGEATAVIRGNFLPIIFKR